MNQKGFTALIVIMVALILVVGAAAVLLVGGKGSAGTGGPSRQGPRVGISIALARSPTGLTATVTTTNQGTEDLKNLRLSAATLERMTGSTPLPLTSGPLPKGTSRGFILQFMGAPPASGTPIHLDLVCRFAYGWFGNGMDNSSITVFAP